MLANATKDSLSVLRGSVLEIVTVCKFIRLACILLLKMELFKLLLPLAQRLIKIGLICLMVLRLSQGLIGKVIKDIVGFKNLIHLN